MFYTIYKITNIKNGNFYIGKHQTNNLDDGYMGSGKILKSAIEKHGIENFTKEIIHVFETESEMNAKEAELVTEEFILRKDTYNLCPGGHGGWGYVNATGLRTSGHYPEMYEKVSATLKGRPNPRWAEFLRKRHAMGLVKYDTMTGKTHSEETKKKIGEKNSKNIGPKNSQFGTIWITNGSDNKKIKSIDSIPDGWYIGRVFLPVFKNIQICGECEQRGKDLYWFNKYKDSGMSVSQFVREVYPHNRAAFYGMKNRITRQGH